MSFVVKKRLPLAYLGEGWEEAFITFSPLNWDDNVQISALRSKLTKLQKQASEPDADAEKVEKETEKMVNQIFDHLTEKFVEGKGFNGKELEPITKENMRELPIEVLQYCLGQLQGGLPKNDQPPLNGR